MFTHVNIFSGSGGFELAAQAVGWANLASSEINRYAKKLLLTRFGHTVHADATDTNWRYYRDAVDVLTLSPPCQPHSSMGKRESSADDRDLLHVCPGILDAIRPRVAVLENVPGIISSESGLALRNLIRDMESAGDGYTIIRLLIPAGGAGAFHLRYRLWMVAHANTKRRKPSRPAAVTGIQDERPDAIPYLNTHQERLRAAGKTGILGIYDGLPGPLDRYPGQKIRLMGNAVSPLVVIPIFQAIDAALRVS